MSIDQQRFKEQGFLILRNLIDPAKLESLRANIEHMVDRRRDLALQRHLPTNPACGTWAASGQPRFQLDIDCDADSIGAIDFLPAIPAWKSVANSSTPNISYPMTSAVSAVAKATMPVQPDGTAISALAILLH